MEGSVGVSVIALSTHMDVLGNYVPILTSTKRDLKYEQNGSAFVCVYLCECCMCTCVSGKRWGRLLNYKMCQFLLHCWEHMVLSMYIIQCWCVCVYVYVLVSLSSLCVQWCVCVSSCLDQQSFTSTGNH